MTKDKFYNDLDLHADTVEGDVKLPLVVYGDEGASFPMPCRISDRVMY